MIIAIVVAAAVAVVCGVWFWRERRRAACPCRAAGEAEASAEPLAAAEPAAASAPASAPAASTDLTGPVGNQGPVGAQSPLSPAVSLKASFESYKDVDSEGNTLETYGDLADKIEELKARCEDNSECKGFASTGRLLSAVLPSDEWKTSPGVDLYVRQ